MGTAMIGMYKEMDRVIEKKRRIPFEVWNSPFLATDNETLY